MNLLHQYKNGNYKVKIYDDGTKIRYTEHSDFIPNFPENIDIKITDYCDLECIYCHEQSGRNGRHAELFETPFIDTLHPGTELAIGGGNPLSHPKLYTWLYWLQQKRIVSNLTVNWEHLCRLDGALLVEKLINRGMIHGLGVSCSPGTRHAEDIIAFAEDHPNVVLHLIIGLVSEKRLRQYQDRGLKILLLGYKNFGRGERIYANNKGAIDARISELAVALPDMLAHFKTVSFDNLAIEQLNLKGIIGEKKFNEVYMGDDGKFTMYVDLVNRVYAKNSTAGHGERFQLKDNINDMFSHVRML